MPVRYLKHVLAAALLIATAPRFSIAQSTTSLLTNATVLPRRTFGVRMLGGFHRFDALLGDSSTRNIAASLAADSLGALQSYELALAESYVQGVLRTLGSATPAAFRINAGTVTAAANSRIATFPLMLEYGMSSRLTLGLVVPLVETRTTMMAQLNRQAGAGNVGPNPSLLSSNWTTNATVVKSATDAATELQTRLTQCQANPSMANCTAILAQQATVQALIQNTTEFAGFAQKLYGVGTNQPGSLFIPLATGATQSSINTQLTALRAQYQTFGVTVPAGTLVGANALGARAQLQQLLNNAGYDSLASTDRSAIGDVSLGATFQLANTFTDGDTGAGGLRYRLAVNATARIGTGQPAQRNRIFDRSTGYGQHGMIVGGAMDVQFSPRYYGTLIGSFTKQLGTVDVQRVPNAVNAVLPITPRLPGTYSAGDLVELTAIPRIRLGGYLSLDAIYSLTRTGADTYTLTPIESPDAAPVTPPIAPYGVAAATTHQLGFGFSYSTVVGNDRGPGRIPFEASFRHVETLSASGGPAPKIFLEQLQLRVFFR